MKPTHWKEAKGFRINYMIVLTPEMLTSEGGIITLTRTTKGDSFKGDILFDREFVLNRIGSILMSDLKLTSEEEIIELVREAIEYKRAKLNDERLAKFQEMVARYGKDSVEQLLNEI